MKEQRIQCSKCKYFHYDDYFNRYIMGNCDLFDGKRVTDRMSCTLKEKKEKETEVKTDEESGGRK